MKSKILTATMPFNTFWNLTKQGDREKEFIGKNVKSKTITKETIRKRSMMEKWLQGKGFKPLLKTMQRNTLGKMENVIKNPIDWAFNIQQKNYTLTQNINIK